MIRQNRIVIKLTPIPDNADVTIDQLIEEILVLLPQGKLVRGPSRSGRYVFLVDSTADIAQLVTELSKRDYIAYAEPDIVDREA